MRAGLGWDKELKREEEKITGRILSEESRPGIQVGSNAERRYRWTTNS